MSTNNTLFDTFNAKYLTFGEIAETFIFTHQFEELIKNNHSLLMGPRGSGKTTMLKMLTPMGLHYWQGEKAIEIKKRIPFVAIYVPTDIQWKRQVEQIRADLEKFPKYSEVASRVLVTVNILLSVVATFRSLVEINSNKHNLLSNEANIARKLIALWKINEPTPPNFLSIELSLLERVTAIKNHIRKTTYSGKLDGDILCPEYFFDDYLDQVVSACKAFEFEFKKEQTELSNISRWALCFDELEIAPKWLQLELINHLRGKDDNILFKLTTSPIVSMYDEISKEYYTIEAQENNDFKVIRIWLYNQLEKQRWKKFGKELTNQRLQRKFGNKIDLENLLGTDEIDRAVIQELSIPGKKKILKQTSKYTRGSLFWFLFKELSTINKSFKKFLQGKNIDPDDPVPISEPQKDSVYRKVKQLASYRYILTKEKSHLRSRKVVPLFYGVPYLYEISDGNPRLLIGLLDELISNGSLDESGNLNSFTINLQSRLIVNISNKFIEQIDNHPEANKSIGNKHIHLGEIVRAIGNFFYKEMIIDDFKMDPRNTFTVDSAINQKFMDLIQLALHLGIIIYVNPKEAISQKGLINKEFRLNYLLCPYFKILAREYDRPVKLSSIFSTSMQTEQQKLIFE